MATYLGWPLTTYQDREAGKRGISAQSAAEVIAAEKRLAESMMSLFKNIDERIKFDFPKGF